MCLNVPLGANGKKRKSMTSEASLHVDMDQIVVHNHDMVDELAMDDEVLKRRRLVENAANSGLYLSIFVWYL